MAGFAQHWEIKSNTDSISHRKTGYYNRVEMIYRLGTLTGAFGSVLIHTPITRNNTPNPQATRMSVILVSVVIKLSVLILFLYSSIANRVVVCSYKTGKGRNHRVEGKKTVFKNN